MSNASPWHQAQLRKRAEALLDSNDPGALDAVRDYANAKGVVFAVAMNILVEEIQRIRSRH